MSGIARLKELVAGLQFSEALGLLQGIPEDVLIESDLAELWQEFRKYQFSQGEIFIAPLMRNVYSGKTKAYLQVIDTYLMSGMLLEAGDMLSEALRYPDISKHLKSIMNFSARTERTELCEAVQVLFSNAENLDWAGRMKLGLEFARSCNVFGARHVGVRCLRELREQCENNPLALDAIANCFRDIKEYSRALEIRVMLAEQEPQNVLKKLDVIRLRCNIDKESAREELSKILKEPQNSLAFWEGVSEIYQQLGEIAEAVATAKRALELGAEELGARRRLADLNAHLRRVTDAKSEIFLILAMPNVGGHVLRHLAAVAYKLDEKELALLCTARQFDESRFTPEGFRRFNRSAAEWLELSSEATKLGRSDLELKMVELGLAYFPTNKKLAERKQTLESNYSFLSASRKPAMAPVETRMGRLFKTLFSSKA
jgi:tetratricopeptide (TPR) repeat protein